MPDLTPTAINRKHAAVLEAALEAQLDWADPANREALADIAFSTYPKHHGPCPTEMAIEEVRESWYRYADRLRDEFLPEVLKNLEIVSEGK